MREYQPKPLNRFQQSSAPQSVSDEKFSELKEQMADENIGHHVFSGKNAETGSESKTWFDRQSGKWISEFHFTDGTVERIEGDSRDDLLMAVAAGRGERIAQEREAELEANPVFNSVWEKTAHRWLTEFKWGQRFSKWVEWLPEYRADEVATLIRTRAYELYYKAAEVDPKSLEASYISLLDAGKLDKFEIEADTIRKREEQLEAARAAKAAKKAERDQEQEEAISERQREIAVECETTEAKRLAATKEGMAELRRRAIPRLSGEPIQTLQMSGTAVRLP